ncbi:DUF488 family protein [Epidermidibacterium keratini]|uniref:DUF488 family protein n=1 Tax=Epidermidibacterium keratini TaxID=1891644 RepID=A0A7L4YLE9_9ACTN|nr:DUF488 family protein [Epidermidibacterium keratini]QHB99658.1 DUF488 family protein [Epidermidibacterium keratini]
MTTFRLRRIYDSPTAKDGYRVLADRLWPRGIRKADAGLDLWAKDIAPSNELRKEFHHDGESFGDFTRQYDAELDANPHTDEFAAQILAHDTVTLITASKDPEQSHLKVLADYLSQREDES